MHLRTPVEGTLLRPAHPEPFLASPLPGTVEASRVRLSELPFDQNPRRMIGAAVTCACNERVFVGLVIDFQAMGTRWDVLCFPAYLL